MKRAALALTVLFLIFALVVYVRPLSVYETAVHAYLLAHGFRGDYTAIGSNRIHSMIGGSGPPLLLIHGIASRGEDYALIMSPLARRHRVYVPDLLGFGRSDRPDIDYSIADETAMILRYLEAKHIARCDVMAASMGGWIALKLAAEHPERVRRLVLVDSAGFPFATTLTETTFTPRTLDELQPLIALQTDRITNIPPFIGRDILRRNREHAWVLRRAMRSMLSGRDIMEGHTQRVTMPVLLGWGAKDRMIPLAVGQRMQRELPNARLLVYPDCGHLAIVECRDRFLPEAERFLR